MRAGAAFATRDEQPAAELDSWVPRRRPQVSRLEKSDDRSPLLLVAAQTELPRLAGRTKGSRRIARRAVFSSI